MGDEEAEVKLYKYTGPRLEGETVSVTAGEEPKVLTEDKQKLGARHGETTEPTEYPSGDTYMGAYADGSRSGFGTYTYAAAVPPPADGEEPAPAPVYAGKWKGGLKSGVGELTFSSGAKYHGSFSEGKYHGQGTMYYANGDIYTGEWAAGKKEGAGTYFFKATEAKVVGTWAGNVLQSGTFSDKYGNAYEGTFAGDATSTTYMAGGAFSLCSGATSVVPKPTKTELMQEILDYDKDKNGFIDAAELRAILTRPGTGNIAMGEEEAAMILDIMKELFDKNGDGKLSVAECVSMLDSQFTGF